MDEDKSIFTPEDFLRYEAACRNIADLERLRVPERMILVYQKQAFQYASRILTKRVDWVRPIYAGIDDKKDIGVFRLGVGAPYAAAMLEELIVCGAKHVIEVGIAGGIQATLKPGDIVVVTEAFRDEGTSNHYFPPEVPLMASPRLNTLLIQHFKRKNLFYHEGPVWTTDGIYRETKSKLLNFQNRGALVVNMETSALFAVAKYRQVELASVQVISDVLSENGWKPAFHHKNVLESLKTILDVVIEVLAEL